MLHLVVISSQYSLVCDKFLYLSLFSWPWQFWRILVSILKSIPCFIYDMKRQSRLDERHWMLGAGAPGRPRGTAWGGRREEGPARGTCVHLQRTHADTWQNQYNTAKLKKNKTNKQKKSIPRIFFMVRTTMGLWFLWWTTGVMCPSHHIRGPVISMWWLNHWWDWVWSLG